MMNEKKHYVIYKVPGVDGELLQGPYGPDEAETQRIDIAFYGATNTYITEFPPKGAKRPS
jgi:hypothetical protein